MGIIINLVAANCGYPLSGSSSSLLVANFSDPATPGMVVVFGCSEDLVLTGPGSAACMDNGEWEPDLREFAVRCKGTALQCHITCSIVSSLQSIL